MSDLKGLAEREAAPTPAPTREELVHELEGHLEAVKYYEDLIREIDLKAIREKKP